MRQGNEININNTDVTFEILYQKVKLPNDSMKNLREANALLIPADSFRDCSGAFFPEETYDFYQYLTTANKPLLSVDICCSDENYSEVQLHNDFIRLAEIIVQHPVYDILIGVIASYLYTKVSNMRKSKKDVTAEVTVNVEKNGKTKKISYTGSVDDFERTMATISHTLFEGERKQ